MKGLMKPFLSLTDAHHKPTMRPQWLIGLGFALAILLGALLLTLPIANTSGRWWNYLDAVFTATSATCVTGLTVVDTGTHFTFFGQIVILTLIQLGGLGVMTFGTFLLVLVGRRLSVQNEFVLQNSFGVEEVRGMRSLLRYALGLTILIEGVGAISLTARYLELGYAQQDAIYYGVFHSISAFCNAGFALHPDNLIGFREDPVYLITVMTLIISGGLGFLVLHNLASIKFWRRNRKTRGRLALHSRIVLTTTILLIFGGWLAILGTEWSASLNALALPDRLLCGLFQSVTPRTAGFNAVDMGTLSEPGRFVTILLMFVGGSPGSTAGGVKTTTMVVLMLTIAAMLRGRRETELHSRTIPMAVVREALVIFLLGLFVVVIGFVLLLLTEGPQTGTDHSGRLIFEAVSAFGTVGLSLNWTPNLSSAGRIVIILCMFVGRLGPLAAALIIGNIDVTQRLRYPEEEVVVG
jgi:trk system potassium uptake protein TrkH